MATTYDKASLVMIPSGVKESKLYSIKPTSGDGDFTFSRGTDTATRVNSSGLIEKERSNYLLYSNTFDNAAWTLKRTGSNPLPSVTSGFSDPDGGTSAYRFQVTAPSADNDYSVISQTPSFSGVSSTPFVQSIYVKANGAGQIGKFFDIYAYQPSSSSYRSMENFQLTGDWQRLELFHTFNASGSTMEIVFGKARSSAGGSTLSDMATDVLIYSSQLEFGLAASSPVIKTTASVAYEGITDNLPRLDYHNPDSPTPNSCPSLLLEGSRTNLFTQSEYFSTYWSLARTSLTSNDATSPEGLGNATKVTQSASDTNGGAVFVIRTFTAGSHSYSIFAKAGTASFINLAETASSAGTERTWFNLSSGEVGTTSSAHTASIENFGNGLYRCSIVFTANAGSFGVLNYLSDSDNSTTAVVNSTAYIYGAQLEAGSYPTSYIPTYGTSASRAADVCIKTSATDLIGQTEGTLFVELDANGQVTPSRGIAYLTEVGGTSNRVAIQYTATGDIEGIASSGGSTQGSVIYSVTGQCKAAIAYDSSGYEFFVNGVSRGTFTGALPVALGRFDLGSTGGVSAFGEMNGGIKQSLVFKTRLTNAELAALTTI